MYVSGGYVPSIVCNFFQQYCKHLILCNEAARQPGMKCVLKHESTVVQLDITDV